MRGNDKEGCCTLLLNRVAVSGTAYEKGASGLLILLIVLSGIFSSAKAANSRSNVWIMSDVHSGTRSTESLRLSECLFDSLSRLSSPVSDYTTRKRILGGAHFSDLPPSETFARTSP